MKGKIIEKEGSLYVEYLAEGEEIDSVVKKLARLSVLDRKKVDIGDDVDFEFKSFYTISDEEVVRVIRRL